MSEMTNEQLEGIRERASAATEGPWEAVSGGHPYRGDYLQVEPEKGARTICDVTDQHEGNAEFIANAPGDIAALLAEVDRLTELNRHLSNQLVGMSDRLQGSAKQIQAKAWDEGYKAGDVDRWAKTQGRRFEDDNRTNPYREARNV